MPELRILDHGYVRFIEAWGSDVRIIESARMSTDKGFLGWGTPEKPGDERLLGYLYRNRHETPFEMAGMILEIKAPIFVFREWHRHRTQSYNEMSGRYIALPNENYLPSPQDIVDRSGANANKQAASSRSITYTEADHWLTRLSSAYEISEGVYQEGLVLGVPKELARLPVPVARYSRMRASANLRNWMLFLTLRMAPYAQQEIRLYANAVAGFLSIQFPRTMKLFGEGRP